MISLVIPVFNESKTLEKSVEEVGMRLRKIARDYEIIIAEDGSTDGTYGVASRLAESNPRIKVIHSEVRKGKGRAIKDAFAKAKGDVLVFTDSDLSADLSRLPKLIDEVRESADICIGSRLLPDSKVDRDFYRGVVSKAYNRLTRALFGTAITDFQCGFKAFKRSALPIILSAKDDGWFWDTEMLLIAEREGLKISQIPIEWRKSPESKIRTVRDVFSMGSNLIRLKFKMMR